MKEFFSKYSYNIIRMFINQFAIGIFGAILAFVTFTLNNTALTVAVGVISIVFYLSLIYNQIWEIGAKDRLAVDYKKQKHHPHRGFFLALLANIPNFLIAILMTVVHVAGDAGWAETLQSGTLVVYMVIDGMYLALGGLIQVLGKDLQAWTWFYYLVSVPALLISWIAYSLGYKNFRFLSLFQKRKDA